MDASTKIFAGFALLVLSLAYLYRPAWVLRLNAWARSSIFNDGHILLYRRRLGLVLFVGAILFFYSGFQNLHRSDKPSTYFELQDAYRAFRAQHYKGAITRCQEILKRETDNVHAWALLGAAWSALGRPEQAKRAWEEVLKRDPDHPAGKSHLMNPVPVPAPASR